MERQETGELPCSDETPAKEPPTLALRTPLQGLFQGNYRSPQRQATLKSSGCALPAQSLLGTGGFPQVGHPPKQYHDSESVTVRHMGFFDGRKQYM